MTKNYTPIPCSCQICKKELLTSGLASHHFSLHQDIYPEKPRNYGPCEYCGKDLIGYFKKKFCNSSCAASHSNTLRPPGHPSRIKGNESRRQKLQKPQKVKKEKLKKEKLAYTKIAECKVCKKFFANDKNRKTCSNECKSLSHSQVAKYNLRHRRGKHISPIAGTVYLQSSWEFLLAESLDKNGILWTRPKYLNYTLNGQKRYYYPDFYLVDFDVYLDPKNEYKFKLDKQKLEAVIKENNIKLLILNENQLSWSCIKKLVGKEGFEPSV